MTIHLKPNEIEHILNNVHTSSIADIKNIVIFLGHAHSGHSIIGAIIDSHSNAGIVNELNVLKLIKEHDLESESLNKIMYYFAHSNKRTKYWLNTEYKYEIPNGSQGKVIKAEIIGDKKGGGSIRTIKQNPEVFDKLIELYGSQLKIIHVYRNPLDNIAAYAHYWKEPLSKSHVDRYYENLKVVLQCKNKIIEKNWLSVDYQTFIKKPLVILGNIFNFLELNVTNSQIQKMGSIVDSTITSKAKKYIWTEEIKAHINHLSKLINKK